MIGFLEGTIRDTNDGEVLLQTGGIGFIVHTPSNISFLPGNTASLYIHTHLRDDDLSLYGFLSFLDLKLFETLISVSGVGPKIGLALLSTANAETIKQAISTSNLSFFTSISGVGKKTAQRIILDLKSKVSKGDIDMKSMEGHSELIDSLVALGFQKQEIQRILTSVDQSQDLSSQIKQSLRLLNA